MGSTRETRLAISVELPPEVHDRFRALAASEHRSMAGEMRRLIDQRIAEADDQLPEAA